MDLVVVMEWGEPVVKKVIGIDYENELVKTQHQGYFGYSFVPFNKCLSPYQIDYYFICLALNELKRLEIKKIQLPLSQWR